MLHIGMTLSPTWLSGHAWRRPDSQIEQIVNPEYYLDLARRAESAKLDFVFRPDSLGPPPAQMGERLGNIGCDPTALLLYIAAHTNHIGLLTTASTTFFPPYILARLIMSLHWISHGRAGWNIVTALDGQGNFGLSRMPSAEQRYAQAHEATEIVKALWDTCAKYPPVVNREAAVFDSTASSKPIHYLGNFFQVEGPLSCASHPVPVPLFQAGASKTGRSFAAKVANGTFAACPDKKVAIELRTDLRRRACLVGRAAEDIKVLPGISLYLASSPKQANELYRETHMAISRQQRLQKLQAMIGLDLSGWEGTRKVTHSDLPELPQQLRSRTHSELLVRKISRSEPTVDQLLEAPELTGSAHWQVIGTPGQAIDEIRDWANSGAMDGFILFPGGSIGSLNLALDELPAALAEEGLFRQDYQGNSFASHLGLGE